MKIARIVYAFWTGRNPMSERRKTCFESLRNTEARIVLVTPDNLNQYVLPEAQLHPGYEYLSETHKADYLRTYFMHFYGGGYTDIKYSSESWEPSFRLLEQNDNLWAVGFAETAAGVAPVKDPAMEELLRQNADSLIGNGAYIFKPNTPLTRRWYWRMLSVMDEIYEQLKAYPARQPQEVFSNEYPYPLTWTELLGNVFHPICYEFREHFSRVLPQPNCWDYR